VYNELKTRKITPGKTLVVIHGFFVFKHKLLDKSGLFDTMLPTKDMF
jgi:cytochrome b561